MPAAPIPPIDDGAGQSPDAKGNPPTSSQARRGLNTESRMIRAVPVLALTAGLLAWWGWERGAYFSSVFYPGAIGVYVLLVLLLVAPLGWKVNRAAAVALAAIVGLASWTMLAAIWTPLPAEAIGDAQRASLYAALFAVGLFVRQLLGKEALWAIAPVAAAGAVVGVATTITLATGSDVASYLHDDGTLSVPIGYRNANAAFFLICTWPLLAIAASNRIRWPLRALMIGSATMLIELAILAQSRGSLPAACLALLAYIALSAHRLRAAAVLLLAAIPVLPALPTLLDVFQHGDADATALGLLRDSSEAIAVTSVGSVALAAIALRAVYARLNLGAAKVRRLSRVSAAVAIAAVVIGGTVISVRHGGPVEFIDQRVSEFTEVGYPDLSRQGARFGTSIGSGRSDFWRVALGEGADHLLLGGGPGSFELAYVEKRKSGETPRDPHSLELLMFSELGVPGLLLAVAFLAAAALAGLRARRATPAAATMAAGGMAAGVQWLVQGSYDWFWHYPGVTAAAVYLLGAVAARDVAEPAARWANRLRLSAVAAAVVLAVTAVPLFLAERYTNRALVEWQADVDQAYADLDRAADLNPLDTRPLLIKGVIAGRTGDRALALASFRQAKEKVPESYAPYYLLARELLPENPIAAGFALARAQALNPNDEEIGALGRKLRQRHRSTPDSPP